MTGLFHSYPDQQRDLRWVTVGLTIVATVLLLMRLAATWKNRGWFGLEDIFVVAAHAFLIIFAALVYMSTVYGFGKKRDDIKVTPGGNIQKALMYFWLTQHFYIMTNMFNKLAFLALYYRIFSMPTFRKVCVLLIVISVFRGVSFTLVGIFQCTPIQKVWIKSTPGHCINTRAQRWSQGTSNLLTDIAIFILPMPVISRLNMSLGNRIGLVVLFSIGFLVCLITLLRMATLPQTLVQTDPTWQSAPTNLWSFIESAVGVICACLISLRKTISAYWPQRWRTTAGSNRNYYNSGSGGRKRARTAESGFTMGAMKPKGLGETHASVMTNTIDLGASRHSSQERIIDGITVTKDVVITRVRDD